jgi:hypothetical protein
MEPARAAGLLLKLRKSRLAGEVAQLCVTIRR